MRSTILTTILLMTLMYGCNSVDETANNSADKSVFEQIIIDLNSDNSNDTIFLLDPETEGDPGSFKRIRICGKDLNAFELTAMYAWDTIPKNLQTKNDSSLKSNFIFVKRHRKSSYIILTGWLYATGQEDFALISVSGNQCTVLTRENFNEVSDFTDIDQDGILEIVLNPSWSEGIGEIDSLNASVSSYAPDFVYSVTPASFFLDSGLTKKYNQLHYVWAGLDSIHSVQVIWFRDNNKYSVWTE